METRPAHSTLTRASLVDKCKIMHLGKWNPKHTYTMGGVNLTVTKEEKDLGVIFDEKLEFDRHNIKVYFRFDKI